jgi:hypothetical protein
VGASSDPTPWKPRTMPTTSRRRREWRKGGRSKGWRVAMHAPDPEPGSACYRSVEPTCSGYRGLTAPTLSRVRRRQEPGAGKPHAGIRGGGAEQSAPLPDRFAAGLWLATRDAPGLAERAGENANAANAQLHSNRERSHSGCDGSTHGVCGARDRGQACRCGVRGAGCGSRPACMMPPN